MVPVQAEPKHNKRGLGAAQPAKRKAAQPQATASGHSEKVLIPFKSVTTMSIFVLFVIQSSYFLYPKFQDEEVSKKSKKLSKKMRKMMEHEKHLQEKEFERAFYREFWPDNV